MPRITRFASAMALLAIFLVAKPLKADCEGGPLFPETIFAQDKNTFVWSTSASIDYVKGPLSGVGSYLTLIRGSSATVGSLDTSNDNPSSDTGVYYLVKTSSPPCGSWQSSSGTEPMRDTTILTPCSDLTITEAEIDAAAATAMIGLNDPWSDHGEFSLMQDRFQSALGCATELGDPAPTSTADSFRTTALFCDETYCPEVQYCGVRNWLHSVLILPAGDCMNRVCFDHDVCYRSNCVGADFGCSFSTRSSDAGCESGWVVDCAVCPLADGLVGSKNWKNDLAVCALVTEAILLPNLSHCDDPPCNEPGEVCHSLTGECCLTDDTTCDGVDDDCDGTADEDFVPTATNCGIGVCTALGTAICVDGTIQDDCVPGSPTPELCDGIDNNCDGEIDEGCTSVVTQPGNAAPPVGFFTPGVTRVEFEATLPGGGIPQGISLDEGSVISTATYPAPNVVDYAEDSPTSSIFDLSVPHHLTLTFDPTELGGLPTEVGLVFTDLGAASGSSVVLEAWSGPLRTGTLLASATAFRGDDGTYARNFGDDCFYGIRGVGPITSVHMTTGATSGGLEADVLYFGSLVIEPPPFLSFPLANRTPFSASINSVFDHSMTSECPGSPNQSWYAPDGVVIAYTGEGGREEHGPSVWSTDFGCGTLRGFENSASDDFVVNGHYAGGGDLTHLYYDGHPGVDYKTNEADQDPSGEVDVLAAAPGTVDCFGCHGPGGVRIDHGNGYYSVYLHLSSIDVVNGQPVARGEKIGVSGDVGSAGNPHLHFEVRKDVGGSLIPVDPYGWQGVGPDPYTAAINDDLWIE